MLLRAKRRPKKNQTQLSVKNDRSFFMMRSKTNEKSSFKQVDRLARLRDLLNAVEGSFWEAVCENRVVASSLNAPCLRLFC